MSRKEDLFVCLFVCLFGWLVGWLVGFDGISTFEGYLRQIYFYTNNYFCFKQFSLA